MLILLRSAPPPAPRWSGHAELLIAFGFEQPGATVTISESARARQALLPVVETDRVAYYHVATLTPASDDPRPVESTPDPTDRGDDAP